MNGFYEINEAAARRAKEMNSYSDYETGSATAEYREAVEEAREFATRCKEDTDPIYHDKIDGLLKSYEKHLAAYINKQNEIDARCPSILIAGGGNFDVMKKKKQIRARERNYEYYIKIQNILNKMRSVGHAGINSDDKDAVKKLELKLEYHIKLQEKMKAVNAYYRKHGSLEGCDIVCKEKQATMKCDDKPYQTWQLSNNSAEIRRIKKRIEELKEKENTDFEKIEFDGGEAIPNKEDNRLQIFFDDKPDADVRTALKSNGFRWAPSVGAWQRQLNDNAYRALNYLLERGKI